MTSKLVQASQMKSTRTENGAVAHASTLNKNVDLYQLVGASRNHVENITSPFALALAEDKDLAVRIMLHARDIRQGMGERAVARRLLTVAIATLSTEDNLRIMRKVPEMGRWDDMLVYFGTRFQKEMFEMVLAGLANPATASLVAKWLPRERRNKQFVHQFCKHSGLTRIEYRKLCSQLSNTVEQKLCAKDFASINFSQVPSVASARYQKLFHKVDGERYREWVAELAKPQAERAVGVKVNAGAIYPYDVLRSLKGRGDSGVAQAQWDALPDFMDGNTENILCMSDVSGSMTMETFGNVDALDIGVSLTMYCAERNHGMFKDVAMVYSTNPYFIELAGTVEQRRAQMMKKVEYGSTNLQKAFGLILNLALTNGLAQNELPTKVIIFSDMQFDVVAGGNTNFEEIQRKFAAAGYTCPQLVFWHLAARRQTHEATKFDKGVAMVSGFSPAILRGVLGGADLTPLGVIKKAVMIERYDW